MRMRLAPRIDPCWSSKPTGSIASDRPPTHIRVNRAGRLYDAFMVDVFARRIVGRPVSSYMHTDWEVGALGKGLPAATSPGSVFHAALHERDNGRHPKSSAKTAVKSGRHTSPTASRRYPS